jgi:hypothetical protein
MLTILKEVDGDKRKGVYQHPIIQTVLNETLFPDTSGLGVQFKEYFLDEKLPIPTLALILTAVSGLYFRRS